MSVKETANLNKPILGNRALNRALLERQMLIKRSSISVEEALEHLVGMQAQAPNPPYFGLWTRLLGFTHTDLAKLIQSRQAVRIALMRSTIHLVTARDCLILRPLVQPVLERGLKGNHGKNLTGIDENSLAAAGRVLVEEQPRTFSEISTLLMAEKEWQGHRSESIAGAVRTYVPLVQVPPRGLWGESGQATHTSAEAWLGSELSTEGSLEMMIERYLAAFGPATVKDMQVWSGLTRLNEVVGRMRPHLQIFHDEQGNELFDVPGAPLPDPDTPVPVRFMPEFDNALLSHADRTRIISEEDRLRVFTINGIIRATFLVDGYVKGIWKIARQRNAATLILEPFRPIDKKDKAALVEEGHELLKFAAVDCAIHDIQFADTFL
ncbi:winged helix DNA-binding domain-containing protein [Cohnella sp. WQ 127256]|uniref:winged helix DNA-binding domain-containing protein n=1 Tax=Cohnella sp. WQ 127256 TaxID=2938790 RepID=UPI0021177C70|nr:winged helix DNA-binding domain-containing protein [Cohnella sp. WQ 127256]